MTEEKKMILVVDDEPDTLTFITMVLEEDGFEVRGVSTADDALKAAAELKPALICMDIMMPRKSGLLCYKKLRKDDDLKEIPVVIISGFGHPNDFVEGRFSIIVGDETVPAPEGFIEKPATATLILETVNRVLA